MRRERAMRDMTMAGSSLEWELGLWLGEESG